MIARTWHGRVPAAQADAYHEYLKETGVTDYLASAGNRGLLIQRWTEGAVTHYALTTLWTSVDAIKQFAGEDYTLARYYPRDDEFLLEREPQVSHTEVLLAVMPVPGESS